MKKLFLVFITAFICGSSTMQVWASEPIFEAVETGDKSKVEAIVASGANVNAKDDKKFSPLYFASGRGYKDIVEVLIANGADVNAKEQSGLTALDVAIAQKHKDVVEMLLANGVNVNTKNFSTVTPLHAAIRYGQKGVLELLLANGADVNIKGNHGDTPLYFASNVGHKDAVETLIAKGADVNAKDEKGVTPLHVATSKGHIDIVETLIAKGADVNVKDEKGVTPLHVAADVGHIDAVKLLIANGADANVMDVNDLTPMDMAKARGKNEVVQILEKYTTPVVIRVPETNDANAMDNLKKNLQARLTIGEFGQLPCAPVNWNMQPVDQGFTDIRFDSIPGAYRIVVVSDTHGWMWTQGVAQLMIFSQAGYYTMKETSVTTSKGIKVPAREFRLTPKGYVSMVKSGSHCYNFLSHRSLEITSVKKVSAPKKLSGLGDPYRVKFTLHHSEPVEWARTPEFRFVYSNTIDLEWVTRGPDKSLEKTLFLSDGHWLSENEAMMELMLDAAMMNNPKKQSQIEQQRKILKTNSVEHRALKIIKTTRPKIRERLAVESNVKKLSPCLQMPLREADLTTGFWRKDAPPSFIFYDSPPNRNKSGRENAMAFMQRLEKTGLVREL